MRNASRIYGDDNRFTAHVHPYDAAASGAADGDEVRLVSNSGAVVVPISIVDSVRHGVVVPNGWGHNGGSWRRANDIQGVNSNELVSHDDVEAVAVCPFSTECPFAWNSCPRHTTTKTHETARRLLITDTACRTGARTQWRLGRGLQMSLMRTPVWIL
jgi:anaerobic selenocysteine-containing dehydrogenase